jgi:hypothetical protein
MEKELLFALISSIIYLSGAIPYWKDVWKWRTIPHLFTVFVWFILVGFNCYVLFSKAEYFWLIPWLISLFSQIFGIFFGVKMFRRIQINWFDYFCLFLAIGLLVYYYFSRNIVSTVILTALIDLIAFLPTFKKWWLQPWTETVFAYFMSWVNQIFTLLALSSPNLETSIFWIYMLISNCIFVILVLYRRWSLKWWKAIFE